MADAFTVAAVGDSAMWGQGLRRQDTFARIAANKIAVSLGRNLVFPLFLARSGAKLEAVVDNQQAAVYTLPSGKPQPAFRGDRQTFYDRFPALFTTDEAALRFFDLQINDQQPARTLFGDIPATFPTVHRQVTSTSPQVGATVDLLFMNGLVNDLDFEDILDPRGSTLEIIDAAIKNAVLKKLATVLRLARKTFPNALIVYTGYFSPFSQGSDRDEIERLFKYLESLPGWKLLINDFLEHPIGAWTPVGVIANAFVDTAEELVRTAVQRSEFAFGRGLFWILRAVSEFQKTDTGPGILFAHPGFGPNNGLFGSEPLLHEGYHPPDVPANPGGGIHFHPVRDALVKQREDQFPRIKLIGRLTELLKALRALESFPGFLKQLQPKIRELHDDLDGPQSLRGKLNSVATGPFNGANVAAAISGLESEIASLKVAQIASFVHPNEAGARRYADVIFNRFLRFRKANLAPVLRALAPSPGTTPLSVVNQLRRYGLNPAQGLQACVANRFVDCLAVETVTDQALPPFTPTTFQIRVNKSTFFSVRNPIGQFRKAGGVDLFVVDTKGELQLSAIDTLTVGVDGGIIGDITPPIRSIILRINGIVVFEASVSAAVKSGKSLVFRYPR
jgi:hypothetical protein